MEEHKNSERTKKSKKLDEILKIVKWSVYGGGVNAVELLVYTLLIKVVFKSLNDRPVKNALLNFLKIEYLGYLLAFFISACVGYTLAFIINRKFVFKADSNVALSAGVNTIFVIFNIFATTWIGAAISGYILQYGLGTFGDLLIKLIVMLAPALWVYPMNRFVIHRIKRKRDSEE